MSKSLRLSEQWFKRALWVVSFVFAIFLSSLGSVVIEYLPRVEESLVVDDFLDPVKAKEVKAQIDDLASQIKSLRAEQEAARFERAEAESKYFSASEAFKSWLETRAVTQDAKKDPEVMKRQQALDELNQALVEKRSRVTALDKRLMALDHEDSQAHERLQKMSLEAGERWANEQRLQELRVFGYRLAMTLPLLAIAGWLLVKKRRSQYWPFVWGFAFFAGMTFFVELVPYLPSYGGFVRYTVGVIITVLVGRYLISALKNYMEHQKEIEKQDDAERRKAMQYDAAQAYLSKGLCPGCERPADLKSSNYNHCAHCGLGLFESCSNCGTRKSSFTKFCHSCGHPHSS